MGRASTRRRHDAGRQRPHVLHQHRLRRRAVRCVEFVGDKFSRTLSQRRNVEPHVHVGACATAISTASTATRTRPGNASWCASTWRPASDCGKQRGFGCGALMLADDKLLISGDEGYRSSSPKRRPTGYVELAKDAGLRRPDLDDAGPWPRPDLLPQRSGRRRVPRCRASSFNTVAEPVDCGRACEMFLRGNSLESSAREAERRSQ